LQLQADGMAGHLDEFWPDVADSAWIGGTAEGWERAPYWLDALVPLSALLNDDRLIAKVERWIGYLIEHQDADGWIGPGSPDVWPRMIVLKALLQYHSAYADKRAITTALRLCRRIDVILEHTPLYEWGRARWADLVYSLDQLYELSGESWLLMLGERVRQQGYDWIAYADAFPYREKMTEAAFRQLGADDDRYLASHGVNVAMGLKAFPVWSRHGESHHAAFGRMLASLDHYHGQATGVFTADEHLAGLDPAQGTETCAVVEYLFSLAIALETWGADESLVDRWEHLAFNALPASARANECGHQYDQQANQVSCHVTEDRVYTNNGPDSNTFGLAPHFGCCTANRHQGWPKFAARLWMRSADGLVALSYAPCVLDTEVDGQRVRIEVAGDYPFGDRVDISVAATGTFPIQLRIPHWAHGATIAIDGGAPTLATAGSTLSLHLDWAGQHTITLMLPANIEVNSRRHRAIAISRGPLVFALAVTEEWRQIGGQEPYGDWEVHPLTPWNYSLEIDLESPALTVERRSTADAVFTPEGAPIRLHGRATVVPQWTFRHGAADTPPTSPCPGDGAARDVVLLPYGAARLRVTELPWHPPRT